MFPSLAEFLENITELNVFDEMSHLDKIQILMTSQPVNSYGGYFTFKILPVLQQVMILHLSV